MRATCLKRNAVRDRPKLNHSVFVVIECGARLTHFYEYVVSASRAPCDNVASASIAAVVANDLFQSPRFPPRSTSLCRGFSLYLSLSLSPLSRTLSPFRSLPLSLCFALYLSLPSLLCCDLFACNQHNDITDRTAVYVTPSRYHSYEGSVHVCVQQAIDNYILYHIHGTRPIARAPHYM